MDKSTETKLSKYEMKVKKDEPLRVAVILLLAKLIYEKKILNYCKVNALCYTREL